MLGRKLLAQVATTVTRETILAWHRKLVGKTMTAGRRTPSRPQASRDLAEMWKAIKPPGASFFR